MNSRVRQAKKSEDCKRCFCHAAQIKSINFLQVQLVKKIEIR